MQIFGMLCIYLLTPFIKLMPGVGLSVAMYLAILFFYMKYDLLKRNWLLLDLEYEIIKEGITFTWGVTEKHSFFLPYDHIVKVTHVGFDNSKFSKIYFHTLHDVLDFDLDHLTDDKLSLICLEEIPNGKKVFELIEYLRTGEIKGTKLEHILLKREMSKLEKLSLYPSF